MITFTPVDATEYPNFSRSHMPLYWLCYRHNNSISVVIEHGTARHAGREKKLAEIKSPAEAGQGLSRPGTNQDEDVRQWY